MKQLLNLRTFCIIAATNAEVLNLDVEVAGASLTVWTLVIEHICQRSLLAGRGIVTRLILTALAALIHVSLTGLVTLVRTIALRRRSTVVCEAIHVGGAHAAFLGSSRGALCQHLINFLWQNDSKSLYNLFILSLFAFVIFFLISIRIVLDV